LEPASLPLLQLDELEHFMTDHVAQQKPRMHKQGVWYKSEIKPSDLVALVNGWQGAIAYGIWELQP